MTAVDQSTSVPAQAHNVFARLALIVTSPGAAYAEVAARPRASAALAVVVGVMIVCQFLFLSTPVGQQVLVDQQLSAMESFGVNVTDEMENRLQARAGSARYTTAVSQIVTVPIVAALIAALLLAIFNATSEHSSTFKHLYAVVAHSGVVFAIQQVVTTPLSYLMGEFATVTRLSVFFPMLEPDGLPYYVLSGIELFLVWWLVNLAIGVAVLYRRPPRPVVITLLSIYAVLVVVISLLRAAF